MDKLFRIIDANINRVSEGIRVLEDIGRFYYNNKPVSQELKILRHNIRKSIMSHIIECIEERDSANDVGVASSMELNIDKKENMLQLITGNFKRIQEGLRVVEENLKVLGYYDASKLYESFRFKSYNIEKEYFKLYKKAIKENVLNTDLYCLTSEEFSNGRSNIEVVKAMIDSGIKVIQYREKNKTLLEMYNECMKIRELTKASDVTFIVNDNIDIAVLVKADGVHIGQDDIPIEGVRQIVGEDMIIGISTHSPVQALDAIKRGADYIGVGPIYRTFTKKNVCDPVGLEYLDFVVKNTNIPFVAIGGIKVHNMDEVISHGANCIAMVTEIVGAEDICKKIREIRTLSCRRYQT